MSDEDKGKKASSPSGMRSPIELGTAARLRAAARPPNVAHLRGLWFSERLNTRNRKRVGIAAHSFVGCESAGALLFPPLGVSKRASRLM